MDILFAATETGLAGINWNTVFSTALGIVQVSMTSLLAIYMVKVNTASQRAIADNEEIKKAVANTIPQLDLIHTAVNSGKTAMENEIKALHAAVLDISKQKSALEQEVRGRDLEASRSQGAKEAVAATLRQPTVRLTDNQLFQMIQDLSRELELRKKNGTGG